MRISVLLLVLLVLAPAAASASGETSIFYYPWYGTPERDGAYLHWDQGGHVPPQDLASSFYPVRGAYSSFDGTVLRAHLREIAAAGVDEVVSSWWGWGSPEDLGLPAVMRAARARGVEVAVQVEPYEKWQRTAEVLENDLTHLRDLGITRVYVFRPFDGVIDDASWVRLNREAVGLELVAQTGNVARAAAAGFEGVYTYDVLRYGPASFARLCTKARTLGLSCAPSVGPGYDARRASGDPRVRPRRNGLTYDAMWRAALKAGADRVTITSYNEWHEGTQIEPAAALSASPVRFPRYRSYQGAYGLTDVTAERAYLVRTALWTQVYRVAAAATAVLRIVLGGGRATP